MNEYFHIMTVAFLIPLDPHIERVEKDNMKSVIGLLLALAICKSAAALGGNETVNGRDSYTINILIVNSAGRICRIKIN